MVAFTHTDVHKHLGTLTNGTKIVSSKITVTSAGATATQITVPLMRIKNFAVNFHTFKANVIATTFAAGTFPNQVSVTPTGGIDAAVFEIISFGV